MDILVFLLLLLFVFLLSQKVTRLLSNFLMRTFHSHGATIQILSLLFLPGVILHEFSHLLVANLLFVQTGEIEFLPEIHGNQVKMGSVAVAKTDPFRRFLIGVAPIVGGFGAILLFSYYLFATLISWQSILLLYIIFQISNTMFSSSKDMEGALGFGGGVLVLGILLQVFGVPIGTGIVTFLKNAQINSFFIHLSFFLAIAAGIDMIMIGVTLILLKLRKNTYLHP